MFNSYTSDYLWHLKHCKDLHLILPSRSPQWVSPVGLPVVALPFFKQLTLLVSPRQSSICVHRVFPQAKFGNLEAGDQVEIATRLSRN